MHLLVEVHLRWLTFYDYILSHIIKNVKKNVKVQDLCNKKGNKYCQ